mmetsp:Transcript_21506/g.61662  ORF Transcript_21506/g.61662 Transcript_21506/m.61662 type:complete len:389 (-) Transcript_21506:364-1530(-)
MASRKLRKRPLALSGGMPCVLFVLVVRYIDPSLSFQPPIDQYHHCHSFRSQCFASARAITQATNDALQSAYSSVSDFGRQYPNVIVPIDVENDDNWVEVAAQYVHRYGVCALLAAEESSSGGVVNADNCDAASNAALDRLAELHRRIGSRGEDPTGADGEYRYLEVVCRDPFGNRFDMPVGWMANEVDNEIGRSTESSFDHPGMPLEQEQEGALEAFHSELDDIVSPVVQRLFDSYEANSDLCSAMSVASAGFLINRPGSTAQKWHKDGPDRGFIDVFVPLIGVAAELGPTEVQVGTHDEQNCEPNGEAAKVCFHESWEDMPYSVAPILNKGEILLLDYRTFHRGLGNTSPSTTRPLAYAVYKHEKMSGGDTTGDVRNFPVATTLEYD